MTGHDLLNISLSASITNSYLNLIALSVSPDLFLW